MKGRKPAALDPDLKPEPAAAPAPAAAPRSSELAGRPDPVGARPRIPDKPKTPAGPKPKAPAVEPVPKSKSSASEPAPKLITREELKDMLSGILGGAALLLGPEWKIKPEDQEQLVGVWWPIAQKHGWRSGSDMIYIRAALVSVSVLGDPVKRSIDRLRGRGRAGRLTQAPAPTEPALPIQEPAAPAAVPIRPAGLHAPEPAPVPVKSDPFAHDEGFPAPGKFPGSAARPL